MSLQQYRQGDVLLIPVAKTPRELKPERPESGRMVIARGELTGHAHTVSAEAATIWMGDEEQRFLQVLRHCALTHDEHSPLALEPGTYRIVHQREYTPQRVRWVAD